MRVYQDIVNALPSVSITSPGNGSELPAGNVTIDATASDSDGSIATVEFWNGFDYLGEDTSAPYSFVWTSVPDGCYQVVARVIDDLGGVATDAVDITVGIGCGQSPYLGGAFALPTMIQAEDFDLGGEGIAYHDTDTGNNGSQYRPSEDVDIETCADSGGGFNVGWLVPGEWTEYTVSVPTPGDYEFDVRVASLSAGGTFHLEFNGIDETGAITVPVTGGWQTWTTVTATATLAAGTQTMRFAPTAGEFNINYFDVTALPTDVASDARPARAALHPCFPNPFNPTTTIAFDIVESVPVSLAVYDVAGRRVATLVDGEVTPAGRYERVWNGRDDRGRTVASGVYFYRLGAGPYSETRRMVLLK